MQRYMSCILYATLMLAHTASRNLAVRRELRVAMAKASVLSDISIVLCYEGYDRLHFKWQWSSVPTLMFIDLNNNG